MNKPSIHPSAQVGPGVNIAPDAAVGPNCVLRGAISIGARATLGPGVCLGGAAVVAADCRIDAGVKTTEDLPGDEGAPLVLGVGVQVGAGSVLRPGLEIGTGARIEPGSVVTRAVPAHAIVAGNPAVVVGFVTTEPLPTFVDGSGEDVIRSRAVAGVSFHRFPMVREPRGSLIFSEFGMEVPFVPKRYFMVHDVPPHNLRGTHARETCGELLVCVAGSINAVVDDGLAREEYVLDQPHLGLYIPPLVWATQYKHTPNAILMVFATHHYDAGDYIVDYEGFVAGRQAARKSKR